jgi:hypothetical protein
MNKKLTDIDKSYDYKDEQIKENCIIEFLCLLTDKPVFSMKKLIDRIKKLFKR